MNRKERIQMVRRLMWSNNQMTLPEIAKMSGVSLRTTYRDIHAILSRPTAPMQEILVKN
jgi:predicted DNA-binding transcriptional regulator YafY